MRKLLALLSALCVAGTPAQASTATLRLTAIIPVSCAVDLVGASIVNRKLVLEVRRECNTAHNIVVTGQRDAALGEVTVRYNDQEIAMHSDFETIAQPENYYDGLDRIVITVSEGTLADLQRYVQSLNIAINTA